MARTASGTQVSGAGRTGAPMLEEALRLLPTPREREWKGQGYPDQLPNVVTLLPTPLATEYGRNQSPSAGAAVRHSLPGLVKRLPTPRANDGLRLRQSKASPGFGRPLEQILVEWPLSGDRIAPPSDAGKPSSDLRLSPSFVEWMIGAPAGWTDPDCPLSATEFKSRSGS